MEAGEPGLLILSALIPVAEELLTDWGNVIILHRLMVARTVQEVTLTRSHVILITALVMVPPAQVTLLEKLKK